VRWPLHCSPTSRFIAGRRRRQPLPTSLPGVLEEEMMLAAIESLCKAQIFTVGDHVKTLRGSAHGVIKRILDDGRVVWQPEGTSSELTALPESLLREKKSPRQ